jgi:hypothetical protein
MLKIISEETYHVIEVNRSHTSAYQQKIQIFIHFGLKGTPITVLKDL